ncbi:unnamed protein product [Diamesa serratosioi]
MEMFLKFVILLCIIVHHDSCAQQIDQENGFVDAFIANGTEIRGMPNYIASIRLRPEQPRERFNNGYICTAIFITREHLITAASCISQQGTFWAFNQLSITAGTSFRSEFETTLTRGIRYVILHPLYSFSGQQNNIAIVFLDGPLSNDVFRVNPLPLSLITDVTATIGSQCFIMGWQPTFSNESMFNTGSVTIMNNALCTDVTMDESRICAGPDHIRACQYDDGGPLVCNETLFGLIGYKAPDHCVSVRSGQYEHYVNIAMYRSWIISIVPFPSDSDGDAAIHSLVSYLLIVISVLILKFLD